MRKTCLQDGESRFLKISACKDITAARLEEEKATPPLSSRRPFPVLIPVRATGAAGIRASRLTSASGAAGQGCRSGEAMPRAKKYQLVKAQDQPWPGSRACSRKVKMPFIDQCSRSGQAFTLGQPSSISWQHVPQGEPVAAQSAQIGRAHV